MMRIGKFTDFYRDVTKAGTKIPQEKYLKVGHYPVIDQGRQAIVGRWDSDDGICKEIPAIIFGDHTRAIKYIEEPFFIGADGVKILRPVNVQDNPKYLYYALQAARIPNLGYSRHFKALKELDFHVCSIEKQDEIVRILEKIDYLIEQCHEEDSCLNQIVKSRFIELFVETDEASEWSYHTIADVSNDMRTGPFGSALHHDEFVDSGVFVLGIDNAVENKFSYNRMRYITEEKYQQLKRYTVYPGDVIITIMGTVGRSAVIPADMPKAINTKHLACITPNVEMVNAQFLSCAFQIHPDIRTQLQKQCKGAIMAGLNLTIIKGLSFRIPPITLQNQFLEFYEQTNKSKYYSQKFLTLCRSAANIYEQEWMKCQTLNF